jgi:RNA polymerase sigma-70 factor, ECF subfamily
VRGRTSDAKLMSRARRDPAAFRELYERHAERIFGYLIRRTGDRDAAHDLTAETFAQAWFVRERFRDEADGSLAPWLFGIARNVLLMSVRRGRMERSACERLGMRLQFSAVAPEERWLEGIDDLLDELSEGQREAIRLRVFDDLAYEQVAERLGTSPEAARVRVHRGLHVLRNRLEQQELTR